MKIKRWDTLILSDVGYEHLVAEVSVDGQFLLILDREEGRDAMCVAFPNKDGGLGPRIPLAEFVAQLNSAAENLAR